MRNRVFVVLAICAITESPSGQLQFDELDKQHLPPDQSLTNDVALGDVDGDGDLDLVSANGGLCFVEQNGLFLNDGTGIFVDATVDRLPTDLDENLELALCDVELDGDLDLVLAGGGDCLAQQNRLYLNDGRGFFTDVTATHMPQYDDATLAVAWGDVDGDGFPDLVFGTRIGQNRLYLNDGTGGFIDATATHLPADDDNTRAVMLRDVDADGDLDLVLANDGLSSGEQNRLYINEGTGTFVDETAARMPPDADVSRSADMFDADGDGDLDVVFGNHLDQDRLLLNDGAGSFTDVTATHMPVDYNKARDVAACDVDADGDADLVFASSSTTLYLNDGTGVYGDATAALMPSSNEGATGLAVGDLDGDGDIDLALGNSLVRNRLYLNDGDGTFTDGTASRVKLTQTPTYAVAMGDVDRDGALDLLLGNLGKNFLLQNDGTGWFVDVTAERMPSSYGFTRAVALGDVDGNGDLDLVTGNGALGTVFSMQNELLLNDGTGKLTNVTSSHMPTAKDDTSSLALGDVDEDGDLDIVFGNEETFPPLPPPFAVGSPQNALYVNDGSGVFSDATAARVPPDSDDTLSVVLFDADGDGDVDLALGNRRQQNRLYLNDGTGIYSDDTARLPTDGDESHSVVAGDVDGDGDLDLVFGNNRYGGEQNRLYLNDGTGFFTDVTPLQLPIVDDYTSAVVLSDVDEDGDPDLILGNGTNSFQEQNRLLLNDGTGNFADVTAVRMPTIGGATQAAVAGDVDGDGDPDLVFGNTGMLSTENRLYLNLLRQLNTPYLARLGHEFEIDAYARHVPGRPFSLVLPFLAIAAANIPHPPLGTWLLDPSQTIALQPFVIGQQSHVGSVTYSMPHALDLVGVKIWSQALFVQYPQPSITNATGDVLIP